LLQGGVAIDVQLGLFVNDFLMVAPLGIEPKMGHTLGYGTHL